MGSVRTRRVEVEGTGEGCHPEISEYVKMTNKLVGVLLWQSSRNEEIYW